VEAVTMTKKNYLKAAKIVKDSYQQIPAVQAKSVEEAFVRFFQDDNPRFDQVRFIYACQLEVR
jgi:hypothetical protein